jgi:hypothetical protein
MYESQWRVVFYALLENFRIKTDKNENKMEEREIPQLVKETLRLYAPVKTVKRVVKEGKSEEEPTTYVYPIAQVYLLFCYFRQLFIYFIQR